MLNTNTQLFNSADLYCPAIANYGKGFVNAGGASRDYDWEQTYEQESPVLYGYLVKKIGVQAAEDILQESFMRLIDMADRNGPPRNIRAYLFQIARNLIIDMGHAPDLQLIADEANPVFQHRETGETELARKQIREILAEAVKGLDPREAEVFDLRWNQGLSTEEIAAVVETSDRHVRRILEKGARKIEDLFKKKGWESKYVLSE